jgi:hypothetical protein
VIDRRNDPVTISGVVPVNFFRRRAASVPKKGVRWSGIRASGISLRNADQHFLFRESFDRLDEGVEIVDALGDAH